MSQKLKLLRNLNEGEKMAPQLRAIVEALSEIGIGKEVDRKEFVKVLSDRPEKLVTRQPVERILAYYAPQLKEQGLVEFIRSEPAAKTEKAAAEKPAKAEKPVKAA
jgi:hypothetical protein